MSAADPARYFQVFQVFAQLRVTICRSFIDGRGSDVLSARSSAAGGLREMDVLIDPPPILLAI